MDLVAEPPAEVEADDHEHDAREQVEADQAPPERPGGRRSRSSGPPIGCGVVVGPVLGKRAGRRARTPPAGRGSRRGRRLSLTTCPVSNMYPCKRPQSSAQRIEKVRSSFGLDVGDVVDAGIGVGLDPQSRRPERMDHVERGDVQRDLPVDRQLEMGGLDAAVGRVAVGELPLLGDHLHRQRVCPTAWRPGPVPGRRPSPSSNSRTVPKVARKRTMTEVTASHVDLDAAVAPDRDALLAAPPRDGGRRTACRRSRR